MHPREFEVNQTWLAFRMNRLPVLVAGEELDIFVLQDAASMFIFGSAFASPGADCPPRKEVTGVFEQAWSRMQQWPQELVLPGRLFSKNTFAAVARSHGIAVRSVAEARMSFYITDVQSSFEEHSAQQREAGGNG
jgi:hypothetical protein